jgi:hypothetical protein
MWGTVFHAFLQWAKFMDNALRNFRNGKVNNYPGFVSSKRTLVFICHFSYDRRWICFVDTHALFSKSTNVHNFLGCVSPRGTFFVLISFIYDATVYTFLDTLACYFLNEKINLPGVVSPRRTAYVPLFLWFAISENLPIEYVEYVSWAACNRFWKHKKGIVFPVVSLREEHLFCVCYFILWWDVL